MRTDRTLHAPRRPRRRLVPLLAAAAILSLVFAPAPARATFHLVEVNKILTSYNGNAAIQAIELRMISGGQNLVNGVSIRSYDAAGVLLATHGTFAANVASGVADRKILCATSGFAAQFGITPDLVIAAGLPLATGQVSFETAACLVNAIAYGDVTVPRNGTTSAPAIPSGLAYVLARTVNNTTTVSCPLAENAAARFVIRSASTAAPVPFANNAGTSVNVLSTLTGVADAPPAPPAPRAFPNPFRGSVRIDAASASWIGVFDVRGALVRVVRDASARAGASAAPFTGEWDGRDADGRRAPAGVYFIRFGRGLGAPTARVALLR
ncbi:MAG TPA: hypothetical protein VFU59_06650 [Candidatus Eisenbacteria bacterium]|nr:hypothetical protein [Candidatus Eisenbacteria bacterium]